MVNLEIQLIKKQSMPWDYKKVPRVVGLPIRKSNPKKKTTMTRKPQGECGNLSMQ